MVDSLLKRAALALALLLPGLAFAQKPALKTFRFTNGISVNSVSDNGKWATASGMDESSPFSQANPYLLNIETGDTTLLLSKEEVAAAIHAGTSDVSNDGSIVIGSYKDVPAVYSNGTWTNLESPELPAGTYGKATAMTPDGRYKVGYYNLPTTDVEKGYGEVPAFWDGTKLVNLPGSPTIDATGEETVQTRYIGLSSDGNTVLGCASFSHPGWGLAYFLYFRDTKTYKFIGENVKEPGFVYDAYLSNNGKFVSGLFYYSKDEDNGQTTQRELPYVYDVANDKFTLFDAQDDENINITAVGNDGLLLGVTPPVNPVRSLVVRSGNYWYKLADILKSRYNYNFTAESGYDYTGLPISVSDDGRTFVALAETKDANYVLTMPEDIREAAKSVNLLSNYSLFPTSGTNTSTLSTFSITFDRSAEVKSGARAAIYDGETVKGGSLSIKQGVNSTTFNINFKKLNLEEGKTYTLKIPAGTFIVNGDESLGSPEITATYKGRAAKPVYVTKSSPENNALVSELSYNSPLALLFDVPVAVANGAVGKLYQGDNETPLTNLTLSAFNNTVAVYPALARKLYKNEKYVVVLPDSAFTDVLGENPSQKITLNFTGSYERPLPEPGSDIFSEDFNNPAESYNNFLLYEGDHNTPNAQMQAMSFDKDNTPWNFTIRESETSNDYCAASTSMYTPAGTSDDWMSTIQLHIPSTQYVLSWKSQNYKAAKDDALRVYVWANDAILSSLNSDIVAQIKKEGKVVYEGYEYPGKSEEGLSGDWTEHKVSLDDFKGKNIYIAFANNNEDQSMIFVDDVKVSYEGAFSMANTTESAVTATNEVEVSGYIKVKGEGPYTNLKAYFHNSDNSVSEEINQSGLSLKKDEIYKFTFSKKLPAAPGKITNYTIGAELDGNGMELNATVKNLAFQTNKRVVLEEGTGQWCTWCTGGIVAIDHLNASFPNNFIPIAVHSTGNTGADIFAEDGYAQNLGFTAFPTGRVDRVAGLVSPINHDSTPMSFTSEAGNETFTDAVVRQLQTTPEADISVPLAFYDKGENTIYMSGRARFAVDVPQANYKVSFVLTEDSLKGTQDNAYYNYTDPILGEFGKGGSLGQSRVNVTFNHVARGFVGSFDGLAGLLPSDIKASQDYTFNTTTSASALLTKGVDMKHLNVVCLLLNPSTGEIVNAAIAPIGEGTLTGISDLGNADDKVGISFQGGNLQIAFGQTTNSVVTVSDLSGRTLAFRKLNASAGDRLTLPMEHANGVVIVKVNTGKSIVTKKLVMK